MVRWGAIFLCVGEVQVGKKHLIKGQAFPGLH